jgi:hypothetical protein
LSRADGYSPVQKAEREYAPLGAPNKEKWLCWSCQKLPPGLREPRRGEAAESSLFDIRPNNMSKISIKQSEDGIALEAIKEQANPLPQSSGK